MPDKASLRSTFINIDQQTLDITISDRRLSQMAIPAAYHQSERMPPMWEMVYFYFMYGEYHKRQGIIAPGKRTAASLPPPPVWLVAIAGVMWEGIIQGATWDIVKMAISAAVTKLRDTGLAPTGSKETDTSIRAGWRQYSTPGKKQYEMFVSLKRTVKMLPDRHALAYARAEDASEFGQIVRNETETKSGKTRKKKTQLKTKISAKPKKKML
jgi:hypothetical protein